MAFTGPYSDRLRPNMFLLLQNLIFRFLQSRQKVQIWLFEQKELRIEGRIIVSVTCATSDDAASDIGWSLIVLLLQGFDEYMNLVLDEAEEVSLKRKSRKPLGSTERL